MIDFALNSIEIIESKLIDPSTLGRNFNGKLFCVHVRVKDIKGRAIEMKQQFLDKSWIYELSPFAKDSYEVRAEGTIKKLVESILDKVEDKITEEFGEYLVCDSARMSLKLKYDHRVLPLAEFWHSRKSNNGGFDFHTVTPEDCIVFGEAKYNATSNPYSSAIKQVAQFITDKKDVSDYVHLQNFNLDTALTNARNLNKGYAIAFSLQAVDPTKIFSNVLESEHLQMLLNYPEFYIIGVEL